MELGRSPRGGALPRPARLRLLPLRAQADAFLRRRWRESYPEAELAALADFGGACRAAGQRFGIGLSPFELHLDPGNDWRGALAAKLAQLDEAGVDDLALLFDDMRGDVPELAERQASIVDFAAGRTGATRLLCCPTYYSDDRILSGKESISSTHPTLPTDRRARFGNSP